MDSDPVKWRPLIIGDEITAVQIGETQNLK